MSEKMGEVIYVAFDKGTRVTPEEVQKSYVFDRAVELLAQQGVDHPEAREALSFLTEDEQIVALEMAEDKVRLDSGQTPEGLVANALDAYINNDPSLSRILLALSREEKELFDEALVVMDLDRPSPEAS